MADTITVREFRDGDVAEILDVFRAALGETPVLKRTPELFAWKHLDNPFGRSIILLAESGGRLAGVRAFMRWELATPDGRTLRCVRAVDTATHPAYLRRGIFKRLTMEAIDVATGDGVDLIFNTPNVKSGAGYLKMGWSVVGPIGIMVRPRFSALRGTGRAETLPAPSDFLRSPVPARPLAVPDRPARGLRTPRTQAYLEWRYAGHPTARYFMVDAAGTVGYLRPNHRGARRELVVSEVIGPDPAAAIAAAHRASTADYVAAWFSSGGPERRAAIWNGLAPVPKVSALTLVCRPLGELHLDPTELASWDLALGDLELL